MSTSMQIQLALAAFLYQVSVSTDAQIHPIDFLIFI